MKNRKIIIGSRGSKLALIYAEKARENILKHAKDFGIEDVDIKEIATKGDQVQDKRLSEVGGKGLFSEEAIAFPKLKPTDRQTIRPGPAVAAIASSSSIFTPLSSNAFFVIKSIFSIWDLAASSGTTPPNSLWTSTWLETILDKIVGIPCSFSVMIEAAVSSQLDSIPKIMGFLFIKLVFINNTFSI